MPRIPLEQTTPRYEQLPPSLRDALLSVEVAEKIVALGKKHGLNVEQTGIVAEETGYVILGLTRPREFIETLAPRLGINHDNAGTIASDINHEIFFPIREALRSAHQFEVSIDQLHRTVDLTGVPSGLRVPHPPEVTDGAAPKPPPRLTAPPPAPSTPPPHQSSQAPTAQIAPMSAKEPIKPISPIGPVGQKPPQPPPIPPKPPLPTGAPPIKVEGKPPIDLRAQAKPPEGVSVTTQPIDLRNKPKPAPEPPLSTATVNLRDWSGLTGAQKTISPREEYRVKPPPKESPSPIGPSEPSTQLPATALTPAPPPATPMKKKPSAWQGTDPYKETVE